MGIEFTVDNLDDMCALMCDNIVPTKGEKMKLEVNNLNFGEWLKAKRKERHLSQAELAEKIYVYQNSIGFWERGDKTPRLEDAERIVKFFGCELVIREKRNEDAD